MNNIFGTSDNEKYGLKKRDGGSSTLPLRYQPNKLSQARRCRTGYYKLLHLNS